MLGTNPSEHLKGCPYIDWYDNNARWQPNHPLSEVAREVMAGTLCTCATEKDPQMASEAMNREYILNMPEGEEIDDLIMTRIFGYRKEIISNEIGFMQSKPAYKYFFGDKPFIRSNRLPKFSVEMMSAWEVLEFLSQKYKCATAVGREYPYQRLVYAACIIGGTFHYDNPELKLYALAPTAPLAVARLALLTAGELFAGGIS